MTISWTMASAVPQSAGRAKAQELLIAQPLRLLAVFQENNENFNRTALVLQMDPRKVRSGLHELSDTCRDAYQMPLIEAENKRLWKLTPAGVRLAQFAQRIMTDTTQVLDSLKRPGEIPVVTTSSGLPLYRKLRDSLPADKEYDLTSAPIRSAEITADRLPTERAHFFIFSTLFDGAMDNVAKGMCRPLSGSDATELLVIDLEPLQIISNFPVRGRSGDVIHPRDVLRDNVCFLTPGAGVAWDFLEQVLGAGWTAIHPTQHKSVPDLNFGLISLACDPAPQAMVVHGVNEARMSAIGLQNPNVYHLADTGRQWQAATGIARVDTGTAENAEIWHAAQKLWGKTNPTATKFEES